MLSWIDFHTHILDSPALEEALLASQKANVKHWLVNSVDWDNFFHHSELASRAPLAIVGLGWHPQEVIRTPSSKIPAMLKKMEAKIPHVSYLGETGLDFLYAKTPDQRLEQVRVFSQFIDWANDYDKLIIVHTRHAKQEALDLLHEKKADKVILHWFSGNAKQQARIIEKKWVCTVGPTILNSPHMDSFIENQPLELLGLETDSPIPFDGIPSSPDWIPRVGKRVSEIKGISIGTIQEAQSAIFFRFFPTAF